MTNFCAFLLWFSFSSTRQLSNTLLIRPNRPTHSGDIDRATRPKSASLYGNSILSYGNFHWKSLETIGPPCIWIMRRNGSQPAAPVTNRHPIVHCAIAPTSVSLCLLIQLVFQSTHTKKRFVSLWGQNKYKPVLPPSPVSSLSWRIQKVYIILGIHWILSREGCQSYIP